MYLQAHSGRHPLGYEDFPWGCLSVPYLIISMEEKSSGGALGFLNEVLSPVELACESMFASFMGHERPMHPASVVNVGDVEQPAISLSVQSLALVR